MGFGNQTLGSRALVPRPSTSLPTSISPTSPRSVDSQAAAVEERAIIEVQARANEAEAANVEAQCRAQPEFTKRGAPMSAFLYKRGGSLKYPLFCGYGCGRVRNPGSTDLAHCHRGESFPNQDYGCCKCRKMHGWPYWQSESCASCK